MPVDAATLVLSLDEHFGGEGYPGDDRIVRAAAGTDPESDRIRDALQGVHWRDVPHDVLARLETALPFLSADGYRFYLPAFMALCVVDFERAGAIADGVVQSLTAPRPADVERVRRLADATPEMQPFEPDEWQAVLATMRETFRPGGVADVVFRERVSGFTAPQAAIIRDFLEHVRDVYGDEFPDDGPERALERHWRSPET